MIKRDFTTWNFIKQEPNVIITPIGSWDLSNVTVMGDTFTTNTTLIGVDLISELEPGRVYISHLVVQGSADIPPREGDMRTIIDENGYWSTQVFNTSLSAVTPYNERGEEWVTIINERPKRHSLSYIYQSRIGHFFSKIKNFLIKSKA